MNYQLAKKLKKAGFPINTVIWDKTLYKGNPTEADFKREWDKGKDSFSPTLSDLIEACGDGFCGLSRKKNGFIAYSKEEDSPVTEGKTPEIAVAKLWLKLIFKK